jgi:hypothetical protein
MFLFSFFFGGGGRPVHKVKRLFRCNRTDVLILFAISSPFPLQRVLLNFHLLPSSSWSSKSRFLVSSLPSWRICCLQLGVHPFEVLNITLSLVRSLPTELSLRRTTFARRVVFGLKMSLMRRATVARRGISLSACTFRATSALWLVPLRAAVSLLWHPSFSWVRSLLFRWFRSLRLFFLGSPTGITSALSAGTSSFCAASGFLSGEVGFFYS